MSTDFSGVARVTTPAVSVVIPCYQAALLLPAAVRSVRTQAGMTCEVVVVDDASTDDSAAVAGGLATADPLVRIVRLPTNSGPGVARNAGLRVAIGRYVAFLDADDEYAPGFLATAVGILDADLSAAGVVTGVELVDCRRPVHPIQLAAVVRSLPANLLVRREVAEAIGGFPEDPAFRGPTAGEDIAFRDALARHFRLRCVETPFLRYRVQPGGHFERFLDRSAVVEGHLVFTRTEASVSPDAVAEALRRYHARVQRRLMSLTPDSGVEQFALLAAPGTTVFGSADLSTLNAPMTPHVSSSADDPVTLMQAGVALAQQGRVTDALPLLEAAVRLAPDRAQHRLNLGVALLASDRAAEAEAELREAVRLDPNYTEAHFNLGNVLRDAGRLADAIAHFRTAVRLRPHHAGAVTNLGLALTEAGNPAEAVQLLRHAVRLDPSSKEFHNNLGLALADLGRFAEAEAAYDQALRLDPRFADALSNLAGVYKEQGRTAEALACHDLAVGVTPDSPSVRYNRSLALLQADDPRGWAEYEWRWRRGTERKRVYPAPRWDGGPLDGRTVLLWCEQGLGDAIQFVRYAKLVKARGARVILECPPRMKSLLAGCSGVDVAVAEGEPLPPHDFQIPLLSLPAALGSPPVVAPWDGPYLTADPQRTAAWGDRLTKLPGFKVGLMWQGNPHYRLDRFRSAPLAAFAPLAAVPGVTLVTLQVGAGAAQLDSVPFRVHQFDPDPDPAGGAFLDTAAILAHLDLVVTVDSAVGHLAGAMGVPAWVLLSTAADWRWGVGRADTPWYPGLRLFRQRTLGDWDELFGRVAGDLAAVAGRRAGGTTVPVDISPGELLDKITILELKAARLSDPQRLAHVRTELAALTAAGRLRAAGAGVGRAGGGTGGGERGHLGRGRGGAGVRAGGGVRGRVRGRRPRGVPAQRPAGGGQAAHQRPARLAVRGAEELPAGGDGSRGRPAAGAGRHPGRVTSS